MRNDLGCTPLPTFSSPRASTARGAGPCPAARGCFPNPRGTTSWIAAASQALFHCEAFLLLIQEHACDRRPDACPLCFLRAAELATRHAGGMAHLHLLAKPFLIACSRDVHRQDDAAELVLQICSLLAAEISLLDLPATAHVVEMTCLWKSQAFCVGCQHHSTRETCCTQYHWDLHPSDAVATVSGLLKIAREFQDVDEVTTCSGCGEATSRQRRAGQLVGVGQVLMLRVVRERWSRVACKSDRMDKTIGAFSLILLQLCQRTYRLRAVVVHRGYDPRAGHCGCYVRVM